MKVPAWKLIMTCATNFSPSIPLDCVMEIVADIGANKIGAELIAKVFWVGGCTANILKPNPTIFGATANKTPDTIEGCCDELEKLCNLQGFGWTPNPENLKLLFDLIMKLLPLLLPLFIKK